MGRLLNAATGLALISALAAAPTLAAGKPRPTETEKAVAEQRSVFAEGLGKIGAHQPAAAIERFDRVIAWYEAHYADEKRQIYCARTPTETLIYMTLAASQKKDAIAIESTWSDAIFFKAFALIDLGRRDEAKPLIERAIAMAPHNSQYLAELAEYKKGDRDWQGAYDLFEQAAGAAELVDQPARQVPLSRAWRGMGFVLIEMGRLDEAEAMFRKCLERDPNDRGARSELDYIRQQRARMPPKV
jgi:tetratricopeptide (TPR) repeat protein